MKIRAFISQHGEANIDIPDADVRRMVESVTKAPGPPPVEDSLAKAREEAMSCRCDNAVYHYETAIRERDERLAQSMTVEEYGRWSQEYSNTPPFAPQLAFFFEKIKNRNEKEGR